MIADINENLDSVFSITWDNYRLVLKTFESKLTEIDKVIEQAQKEGISDVEFRKIEFAGVPDSINSLSQIIIQNSFGGSILEGTDQDDFSDQESLEQRSLFEKIKNPHQTGQITKEFGVKNEKQKKLNKNAHQRHNSLVFSFDADAMKENSLRISEGKDSFEEDRYEKRNNFLRKAPDHE